MAKSKKRDDRRLLLDLLTHIDHSQLSESLIERVNEFIAEYGGCAFCHRPAELLCDFNIGGPIDESHTKWPVFKDAPPYLFTCDAPICVECASHKGHIFFCGKEGEIASVDWCPAHAHHVQHPVPMLAIDAERKRIEWWKSKVLKRTEGTILLPSFQ